MALKFGASASHSKTSSQTKTNSTTTPIVPDWASGLTQNVAGRVGGLLDVDPHSLVAPADPLQNQAAAGAANLTGTPWNYLAAEDLTRGASKVSWLDPYMQGDTPFASGGKAYNYVGNYLNPYLDDVVKAASADLDAHEGQVRAQQDLDLARSGAFGGSGAAITKALTEGELARARGDTLSGLRSHAYDAALGAAAGDAERATQARIANAQTALQDRANKVGWVFQSQQQQLAAADKLAGISSDFGATQRANIETQASLGDTFRNLDKENRTAPFTSTHEIVAMLSGLPISLFTGEQKTVDQRTKSKTTDLKGDFGFG